MKPIKLVGGPLDGTIHMVAFDLPYIEFPYYIRNPVLNEGDTVSKHRYVSLYERRGDSEFYDFKGWRV